MNELLGDDEDWSNPAAMFDPVASVGNSDHARALRIVADDLTGVLHRAAPRLRSAGAAGYDAALAHARTAQGLLRYHSAMAGTGPDRIAVLLSIRSAMTAENLLAIVAQENRRGPCVVFAHNAHLRRISSPELEVGNEVGWSNAGALVALTLGERYLFVATDAAPDSDPNTFQGALAAATSRRSLFPASAVLAPSIEAGRPIVPGHIPLTPADLSDVDAVVFISDTDGKRYQYW
ncbi:erythromycin esterase family protein [Rhodococcus sp. 27YEA15]|uniref:erythromycin esterase family protein n=1 Tax=Rhodococcus sp. 27YEA15 TaxID=3156259 RepID=UPI003C7A009F